MNTEHTAIIILSSLILVIYSIRGMMYLKYRRYKILKPKYGLLYQKEEFVPVTFYKCVYEPDREYDCSECVNKEWVNMNKTINLN